MTDLICNLFYPQDVYNFVHKLYLTFYHFSINYFKKIHVHSSPLLLTYQQKCA